MRAQAAVHGLALFRDSSAVQVPTIGLKHSRISVRAFASAQNGSRLLRYPLGGTPWGGVPPRMTHPHRKRMGDCGRVGRDCGAWARLRSGWCCASAPPPRNWSARGAGSWCNPGGLWTACCWTSAKLKCHPSQRRDRAHADHAVCSAIASAAWTTSARRTLPT